MSKHVGFQSRIRTDIPLVFQVTIGGIAVVRGIEELGDWAWGYGVVFQHGGAIPFGVRASRSSEAGVQGRDEGR